jgi:phosphoenolpyruvate carboxylase
MATELRADVRLLGDLLGVTLREQAGDAVFETVEGLRKAAIALRAGTLDGGREAFAKRFEALDLDRLERVARAFTRYFHLINAAEEQQRIRVLRTRDRPGEPPEGSIARAVRELHDAGTKPDEIRELLGRLLVMPVLTAHPTEARRRTVLDHLAVVSSGLERLDDPRLGAREHDLVVDDLREAILALHATEDARATRPTPLDEVLSGVHVFERTLLEETPFLYRELEDALARHYPSERFEVGPFLRWGSWIGGDRDGNPNVTAEVTRAALENYRRAALERALHDVTELGSELSVSSRRAAISPDFARSLEDDRARLPEVAARAARIHALEPFREKLRYIHARLEATRDRAAAGYAAPADYLDDLRLLEQALAAAKLERLARGRLRDARRRAEVFGFHLVSLDLRQHSSVHEAAVAELLARGGQEGYARLDEPARITLLTELLERAFVPAARSGLTPETRDLLATLDVVGRARRDQGAQACERYVVSFTSEPSDLLEVLFLARAAGLAPDELRPVPLLEQLEDLERAEPFARRALALGPLRVAIRGELEVMIGYSDSGKQAGYVSSQVALRRAQQALARVADEEQVTLTVFHGRGGAVGRGGGPAHRAIRAQPARALRGRFRLTEQGETIAARYARPEIARRDLEQMISAVLRAGASEEADDAALLDQSQRAARAAYDALIAQKERVIHYAIAATPIQEVAELPIASRPASRRSGLQFEALRAIPWVFSWNQSRHGIPGWFGLGSALDAVPEKARAAYRSSPFFRALVDNAQLALVRADIDVAAFYARLADPADRSVFEQIRAEHERTVKAILRTTGESELLASQPAIARAVQLRNPYVDVLSHAQIELLGRLHRGSVHPERRDGEAVAESKDGDERRIREILYVTINGIAAGLQTAG